MGVTLEEPKKVVGIEIHHLDELGYGPNGEYTRREWRELCMEKLLAGKEVFESWQKYWMIQVNTPIKSSFSCAVVYNDGSRLFLNSDAMIIDESSYIASDTLDYVGQVFNQDWLIIEDVIFLKKADFSASLFKGRHNQFSSSVFKYEVSFTHAIFLSYVGFDNVIFESEAHFSKAIFSFMSDFEKAIFLSNAFFRGVQFCHGAMFKEAKFKSGFCNFDDVIISRGIASFDKAEFAEFSSFINTKFILEAQFREVRFNGDAWFINTEFDKQALFENAIFGGVAGFENSTFSGNAKFTNATIVGSALFKDSKFVKSAIFKSVLFGKDAFFLKCEFHGQSRFDNDFNGQKQCFERQTLFKGYVDFENSVFKNVGHFERVVFKTFVPSFLGMDIASTRLEFSEDAYFPKADASEDAIKRLGQLKRLADEHGQVDQALMFNALELNAKRLSIDNKLLEHEMHEGQLIGADWWSRKVNALTAVCNYSAAELGDWCTAKVTRLYEAASDYGRSFTRPLKMYLCFLLITYSLALLSAANHSPRYCEPVQLGVMVDLAQEAVSCPNDSEADKTAFDAKLHLSGYRAAFEFTLYRSAGVLDFSDNDKSTSAVTQRLFGIDFEPWWMRAWGVFKAISTTALLFLMALGLRNKYRVK